MRRLHVYVVHKSCFQKNIWAMGADLAMTSSLEMGYAMLPPVLSNPDITK